MAHWQWLRDQVQPDGVCADGVLGLVRGHPGERQLHEVAVSLAISPLRTRTGSRTPDEAGILDAMIQPIFDHRIVPVNVGGQVIVLPDEKTVMPFLWLLQDKAQSGIVAFILDAVEPAPPTFETHPFGLPHAHAIERLVSTRSQRLSQHRIQMVSQKRDARFFRIRMQAGFREPILLPQGRESRPSFLFLCTRNGARCLPRWVSAHLAQPPLPFGEDRIVEEPPHFQMRPQSGSLPCLHLQGQFEQKRRRLLCGGRALPGLLLLTMGLTCFWK